MIESATGVLHGHIISLDSAVPLLEGKRVRVLLEPEHEANARLSPEAQHELWSAWVQRGPQGPIEDGEDEPEFPG
ncbi:MAG: hypothetical protein HYV07_00125 [Deltaproteobacteria bacterium]|nr:hypothetical protein [Deltaproteobacteria bacterium]